MKKNALIFWVLALGLALPAFGLERLEVEKKDLSDPESAGAKVEVGAVAGWPVTAGFAIGYWGDHKMPLVARLCTGLGTTVEVGWGFKNERDIRAYIGMSAGAVGYLNVFDRVQYYLGPAVGLRIGDFSVGMGPAVRFRQADAPTMAFMGYVGASGLF